MAHKSNIADRSPNICPAGIKYKHKETVEKCLKQYPLEDTVDALKHEAKIPDKLIFKYKLPTLVNHRNCGIFTNMRDTLNQPAKTRFQTLINDLKETSYQSYWTKEEGKTKDFTGNLPIEIDPYSTTFGKKSNKDISVKELVSPDKNYGQVLQEYCQGHELYRKTHNDYYVNEQINRNYLRPAYNPNKVYGFRSNYDQRGIMLKCITSNNNDNFTVTNSIQSDYQNKRIPKLGESLSPNKNIDCVPEGHTFGKVSINSDSIAELCSENPIPEIKKQIQYYLTYINPLRSYLKSRFNKNLFSFSKFLDSMKYYDKNNTGWIPLSIAREMSSCFKLFYEREEVEKFLVLFNIIKGDQINYSKFVDVLNWQSDFPDIAKSYHVVEKNLYYETTYQAAQNDYKFIDNSKHRPAGIPSTRFDIAEPTVPEGGCKADLDNLGTETDASTIIYPSVYTSYGLSFFDFFMPREKDQIRNIFTNVGYEFDDYTFDKLWNEGYESDKTGLVCVDTFKNLLNKYNINYKSEKS